MASALQKVKAGIGAIAPLLKNEGVDAEIPALGTMQLDALEKADPVKKSELDAALSELADLAKGVRDLNEGLEKRSEELKRLEEPVARRSKENKEFAEKLEKLDKDVRDRQIELKKNESQQADRERELEKRELDARTGFAYQNTAALADLRKEISELESRRTEIQLHIHQAEQQTLDHEAERSTKLLSATRRLLAKNALSNRHSAGLMRNGRNWSTANPKFGRMLCARALRRPRV